MRFRDILSLDRKSFDLCHPEKGLLKYFYYPDFRTVLIFRLSQWCYKRKALRPLAYFLTILNDFIAGVWIGPKVKAGPGLVLAHARGLVVHPDTKIGMNCQILQRVTIGGPNVTIGDNTALNAGAAVISNIRGKAALNVGSHVIIGAGAVVTNDIPDCSIVVGVPGKVVKTISQGDDWVGFALNANNKKQRRGE